MEVRMPVLEIKDLSTTFGLDITVPNGGLVASAANQRAYKTECRKIYDDFLLTMSNYFHEETVVRRELKKLQTKDKAARRDAYPPGRVFSSAGLRKGVFVTQMTNRPKTVQGLMTSTQDNFLQHRKVGGCVKSVRSEEAGRTYDGVMDQKAEYSSDRRVKMSEDAFVKLGPTPMDVKFQNKQGNFIMKRISARKRVKAVLSSEVTGPNQGQTREKLALVRRHTNFKSPTLSSDLKINNIVAIQKSLRGLPSKRMTVKEVMTKATDRKARMFKVQVDEESGSERNQRINRMAMCKPVDDETDTYYEGEDDSYSSYDYGGIRNIKVEIKGNSCYSPGPTDIPDGYSARRFDSLPTTSRSAMEMAIVRLGFHDLPYTVSTAVDTRISPSGLFLDANKVMGKPFLAYNKNTGVANVSARMTRAPQSISAEAMPTTRSKIRSNRDSVAFIKQAQEEDMEREKKLNCWRQRMTFASLKQGSLARVLTGSARN